MRLPPTGGGASLSAPKPWGSIRYLLTPARYRENLERLEALCREEGRDPSAIERALLLFISVATDRESARHSAAAALTRIYNRPFADFVDRYCVFGTPDQCAATIEQYRAAGVRHFVFNWACPQAAILDQLEQLGTAVLPRVGSGIGISSA